MIQSQFFWVVLHAIMQFSRPYEKLSPTIVSSLPYYMTKFVGLRQRVSEVMKSQVQFLFVRDQILYST